MITIKPLADWDHLSERQARMVNGLLKEGLTIEQIRALQWYDPRLEAPVVNTEVVHTESVNSSVNSDDKRKAYRREWMARKRAEAKE